MIELSHISKTFRVARRNAGLSEAFRALLRLCMRSRMCPSASERGKWWGTSAQTEQGKAAPSK